MFFGAFGKPSIFGMVTLVMRCPNYATIGAEDGHGPHGRELSAH